MKRISYLLTIIGAIALVVLVFYFLRYRAGESAPETQPPTGVLPTAPPAGTTATPPGTTQPPQTEQPTMQPGEQKFGVVSKSPAVDYFVDAQNSAVIVSPDGKIIRITQGEESELSSSLISNLSRVEFSYDGKKILAAFGDKNNLEHGIFDVDGKSWAPLASGMKYATWSPSNYQIAYLTQSAIVTLDTSNQNAKPQEVLKFNAEDVLLNWVSLNQIIIASKGTALSASSIWSLDAKNKTLIQLVEDKLGLSYAWNGRAMTGLVLTTDISRRGGTLALYDGSGNLFTGLSFLTMPSKCAFDTVPGVSGTSTQSSTQKFLYCAIPSDQNQLKTKTLPDEYQKKAFFTADNFFKVDLTDGGLSDVFAGQAVDAENLKVSNQNLFFINRLDGKLYAISLK